MKKILFCLLIAFAFLIPYVKADDNVITEVTVTVPSTPPTVGNTIDNAFSVPEDAPYEKASWFNNGTMYVHLLGDGNNITSGTYQQGEKYVWATIVCPKEGYSFKPYENYTLDLTFHVNGIDVEDKSIVDYTTKSVNGDTCRSVEIVFKPLPGTARKFISVPGYGNSAPINEDQHLRFTFSTSDEIKLQKYVDYSWVDMDTFDAIADEAYEFVVPAESEVKTVKYRLIFDNGNIVKTSEFQIDWKDYSKIIDSVSLTLPTYPKYGNDIIKEYSIPEDANYEKASWNNGLLFVNLRSNGSQEVSGKYEEEEYKWSAVVCPKEGYSFADDVESLVYIVSGINLESDYINYYGKTINGGNCRGLEIYFNKLVNTIVETPVLSLKANNNKVTLTWTEQAGEEKAAIYRSLDNKKWTKLDVITDKSYTDSSLTYGKVYYYKVKVYGNGKWTKYSNVVKKKIVPNKVKLSIKSGNTNAINLKWERVATNGYEIYSSINNKKWYKVTTITNNKTLAYSNKSLKANTYYYYKARAYKTVNGKKVYGSWSETIKTRTAPVKPGASLRQVGFETIRLTINKTSGAKYYIAQGSLTSDYKNHGNEKITLPSGAKSGYDDAYLPTGTTIYARVKACNNYNNCSGWVKLNVTTILNVPKVRLTTSSKKVTVKLNKVDGAEGYQVYRSTSKNSGYAIVKEFNSSEELVFDDTTTKGQTYYYKVRAYTLVDGKRVYSKTNIKSITSK